MNDAVMANSLSYFISVGVDAASQVVSHHVAVVQASRWGETTCPICLCELFEVDTVAVALLGCQHCLHLPCLNSLLSQQTKVKSLEYLESELFI